MDHLARRATEEQLTRALARQLGSIELATHVTKVAITTIGSIQRDTADKVATTLATADHIVKAASYTGSVTPDKEAALRRHTQNYLHEMLAITHEAGGKIVDVLLSR